MQNRILLLSIAVGAVSIGTWTFHVAYYDNASQLFPVGDLIQTLATLFLTVVVAFMIDKHNSHTQFFLDELESIARRRISVQEELRSNRMNSLILNERWRLVSMSTATFVFHAQCTYSSLAYVADNQKVAWASDLHQLYDMTISFLTNWNRITKEVTENKLYERPDWNDYKKRYLAEQESFIIQLSLAQFVVACRIRGIKTEFNREILDPDFVHFDDRYCELPPI